MELYLEGHTLHLFPIDGIVTPLQLTVFPLHPGPSLLIGISRVDVSLRARQDAPNPWRCGQFHQKPLGGPKMVVEAAVSPTGLGHVHSVFIAGSWKGRGRKPPFSSQGRECGLVDLSPRF